MLATVREYALDVLAKGGQLEEMQALHADYFLGLCEEAGVGFAGDEPAIWLDRIERDLDNVRAALGFAFQSGRVELGLRIGSRARTLLARPCARRRGAVLADARTGTPGSRRDRSTRPSPGHRRPAGGGPE